MEYRNLTPFPSLAFDALDTQGKEFHAAVLRMTFTVESDGRLRVAPDQVPLVVVDEFYGELTKSSVKQESDLAPYKPWCDVIVIGHAYTPGRKPERRFQAGIRITRKGNTIVDKRITVTGPRYWQKHLFGGWRLTSPAPIWSLPLRYEYAYGGECRIENQNPAVQRLKTKYHLTAEQRAQHPDSLEKAPAAHTCCEANPIGRGFAENWYLRAMKIKRIPAPQIESPSDPIKTFGKHYDPQGLGVIGRAWQSRNKLCGTVDEAFVQSDCALPEDFDFAYWNAAHPDLQVPWLRGDETIDLINIPISNFRSDRLDSQGNRIIRLVLPGHHVCAVGTMRDGQIFNQDFHIDTLIIDVDKTTVSLIYRLRLLKQPQVEILEASILSDEEKEAQESKKLTESLHG